MTLLLTRTPVHPAQALHRSRQRGIALMIVLVLVLVSALLALWGFRSSALNEALVGNDADYLRAFEAAQALIQDAELDISGKRPDGKDCLPSPTDAAICRTDKDGVWFIDEQQLLGPLINRLSAKNPPCEQGICLKRTGVQDFWNDKAMLDAMTADGVAARYGQFTGATTGDASNPILANRNAGEGGWYWVEILQYDGEGVGGGVVKSDQIDKLALRLHPNLVYRITAIARGRKPNTQVVLQSTYARQTTTD
ncbi:PilX N-terminal domain-containing pilus assembly protein [Xenophilus sp. Marseille-Q4582]|uniref:pilus assembly PilX family protein n=1 Tax=Xenophilus sp. Marseille-Q4582 TaxID=2866600 RepID=UPI001CE40CB8|nr:pilus assembly protein [Xenophilus sp. Marseille-Q4582]